VNGSARHTTPNRLRRGPAYREMVRAVLDAVAPVPAVLLGACTPEELEGWPIGGWDLLDCTDEERRRRLDGRAEAASVAAAIRDAHEYRSLGLPVTDMTGRITECQNSPIGGAGTRNQALARIL
jgi:hypothetical protein